MRLRHSSKWRWGLSSYRRGFIFYIQKVVCFHNPNGSSVWLYHVISFVELTLFSNYSLNYGSAAAPKPKVGNNRMSSEKQEGKALKFQNRIHRGISAHFKPPYKQYKNKIASYWQYTVNSVCLEGTCQTGSFYISIEVKTNTFQNFTVISWHPELGKIGELYASQCRCTCWIRKKDPCKLTVTD